MESTKMESLKRQLSDEEVSEDANPAQVLKTTEHIDSPPVADSAEPESNIVVLPRRKTIDEKKLEYFLYMESDEDHIMTLAWRDFNPSLAVKLTSIIESRYTSESLSAAERKCYTTALINTLLFPEFSSMDGTLKYSLDNIFQLNMQTNISQMVKKDMRYTDTQPLAIRILPKYSAVYIDKTYTLTSCYVSPYNNLALTDGAEKNSAEKNSKIKTPTNNKRYNCQPNGKPFFAFVTVNDLTELNPKYDSTLKIMSGKLRFLQQNVISAAVSRIDENIEINEAIYFNHAATAQIIFPLNVNKTVATNNFDFVLSSTSEMYNMLSKCMLFAKYDDDVKKICNSPQKFKFPPSVSNMTDAKKFINHYINNMQGEFKIKLMDLQSETGRNQLTKNGLTTKTGEDKLNKERVIILNKIEKFRESDGYDVLADEIGANVEAIQDMVVAVKAGNILDCNPIFLANMRMDHYNFLFNANAHEHKSTAYPGFHVLDLFVLGYNLANKDSDEFVFTL